MSSQYPWGATLPQCWCHCISPMTPAVTLTELPCHVEPSWCIIWNMKLHSCSMFNNRRSQCGKMCALNTLRTRQNGPWFHRRYFQMHFHEWKCYRSEVRGGGGERPSGVSDHYSFSSHQILFYIIHLLTMYSHFYRTQCGWPALNSCVFTASLSCLLKW